MAKESGRKVVASNRKARHDFHIEDVYEAGLVLTGTEVKALRAGRCSLVDGFAQFSGGELWLEGVHIPEYTEGTWTNHAPRRKRKLLLHKHQIEQIFGKITQQGLSVVPLRMYFLKGKVKLELGMGRGKKKHDKRQDLKKKSADLEMRQAKKSNTRSGKRE